MSSLAIHSLSRRMATVYPLDFMLLNHNSNEYHSTRSVPLTTSIPTHRWTLEDSRPVYRARRHSTRPRHNISLGHIRCASTVNLFIFFALNMMYSTSPSTVTEFQGHTWVHFVSGWLNSPAVKQRQRADHTISPSPWPNVADVATRCQPAPVFLLVLGPA